MSTRMEERKTPQDQHGEKKTMVHYVFYKEGFLFCVHYCTPSLRCGNLILVFAKMEKLSFTGLFFLAYLLS